MLLQAEGFGCVYWIRHKDHTDKNTEGYIGVSSNPARRWREHLRDANGGYHPNNYLSNALIKYADDLVWDIIFGGTLDQCYEFEKELRPEASIGWNLMAGGRIGKITEEGKQRIRDAVRNRKPLTEQQKRKRYNSRYKTNLTLSEYKDMMAIKNGNLPPSVINLKVFCILTITEFASIEEAAEDACCDKFDMLEMCKSKTANYIFTKDL